MVNDTPQIPLKACSYTLLFSFPFLRQPNKLCVVLTRKDRKIATKSRSWEPTIKNPYRGLVLWPSPETLEIIVTLFRDPHTEEYEDKEWTVSIEEVTDSNRRLKVASTHINLSRYTDSDSNATSSYEITKLPLHPATNKVTDAHLTFTLLCEFLEERKST